MKIHQNCDTVLQKHKFNKISDKIEVEHYSGLLGIYSPNTYKHIYIAGNEHIEMWCFPLQPNFRSG